jgi:hypothetical protein
VIVIFVKKIMYYAMHVDAMMTENFNYFVHHLHLNLEGGATTPHTTDRQCTRGKSEVLGDEVGGRCYHAPMLFDLQR